MEDNNLGLLRKSKELIPCHPKTVLILDLKATDANLDVVVEDASEATPVMVRVTKTKPELRVVKKTLLDRR